MAGELNIFSNYDTDLSVLLTDPEVKEDYNRYVANTTESNDHNIGWGQKEETVRDFEDWLAANIGGYLAGLLNSRTPILTQVDDIRESGRYPASFRKFLDLVYPVGDRDTARAEVRAVVRRYNDVYRLLPTETK